MIPGIITAIVMAALYGAALYHVFPQSGWANTALQVLLSASATAYAALYLWAFIPPIVRRLTNNPNANKPEDYDGFTDAATLEYKPSSRGIFTSISPGQAKWIVNQGGQPVRGLLYHPGYMFLGDRPDNDLTPNNRAYWYVVPSKWKSFEGEEEIGASHPIPFPVKYVYLLWALYSPISVLWWLWKRWMFSMLGVVFTGIYPWRRVRTHELEHFLSTTTANGEIVIRRRLNYTDHIRVAQSMFPLEIPSVETLDQVVLKAKLSLVLRSFNIFLIAFNSDEDWTKRVKASVTDAAASELRENSYIEQDDKGNITVVAGGKRKLQEVLMNTGKRPNVLDAHWPNSEALLEQYQIYLEQTHNQRKENIDPEALFIWYVIHVLGDNDFPVHNGQSVTANFGVEFVEVQVQDLTVADEELQRSLAGLAKARVEALSTERLAQANAAQLREQGKALRDFPEAQQVVAAEAGVRMVTAAKPGSIQILGVGGNQQGITAAEAAIIGELRRNSDKTEPGTNPQQGGAQT